MLITTAPALCTLTGLLIWFASSAARAADPDPGSPRPLSASRKLAVLLISVALALYGIVFLLGPTPNWIGYSLLLCAAAFLPGLGLRILPPAAFYVEMLLAGFTFLLT